MSELISIRDFQQIYRLSRSTVYRLHQSGHIPFVKVGRAVRIPKSAAEEWARSLQSAAA